MTHTPGPWKIALKEGSNRPECYAVGTFSDDGTAFFPVAYMESKNAETNAHLIAAAPKLLTALEEISLGKGQFSRDPLEHAENTIENMAKLACAAIAEAKTR